MDFKLTEDQQLLVASVRSLMESENWEPYFAECDAKHEYPGRFTKALGDMGLFSMFLPEEYGGQDCGMVSVVAAWEEIGRLGGPTAPVVITESFLTMLEDGTDEQKAMSMSHIDEGTLFFSHSATEPGAGSDLAAMTTTYTRKNGKVYLNGQKTFVSYALTSKYIYIMAKNSDDPKMFTQWLVPTDYPGITLTPLAEKIGARTESCCEMFLDNVEIDESFMFGKEGEGFNQLKKEFDFERLVTGLTVYGNALCAYEDALKYANQRVQFGETIGRTQLIQKKASDMTIKITNMRNMLYEAAWKYDNGELGKGDAAMCKLYCANAGFEVIDDAMQILCGLAIAGGHRVARFWRDARVYRVSGGSDEMMVLTLGREALKKYR